MNNKTCSAALASIIALAESGKFPTFQTGYVLEHYKEQGAVNPAILAYN